MKKLLLLLITTALPTLCFGALPEVKVTIFKTIALSTESTNVNLNRTNIMKGVSGQAAPTDWTVAPAAWNVVSNNFTFGGMVVSTMASAFHLWLAENPGYWQHEWGNRLLWAVHIQSTNGITFRSADVRFSVTSSDVALNLNGALATNSSTGGEIRYQSTLWGLWYGADRVKGTSDDVWYFSGSSTTPVDELFYLGVRSSYSAINMTEVNNAKAIMLSPGYYASCRYYLRDDLGSGSGTATIGTEPWVEIGRQGNGSLTMHGQPTAQYQLQSAAYLTQPASAIPWVAKPGVYTNGQVALGAINLANPQEYFRLKLLGTSGFAPAAQVDPGVSASTNDGE